ncbi:MAG: hypothetical protein KJO86_04115 [Muriicola sp.]|nr:hypothetical protein [Muriicola sp.]
MKKFIMSLGFVFMMISASAQNNPCACCTENHSDFDFWLGKWEVTLPNGNIAGENVIEKIQGDCILRENWKGASGNFTGTSYNYYNTTTGMWEQLWLDAAGTILKLSGKRIDNQMILMSEGVVNEDESITVQRITWTLLEDGKVRQVWEVLRDGVAENVLFDGLYSKMD